MPFKTGPVSLPGRRIIREAFEGLQQTVSPLEAKDFQNTTLEDVRKAALDIENQLAARRTLRNMRRLMPLFQGLEHYSQSIEVLCNGTPYLPWIWAPIKLILTVSNVWQLNQHHARQFSDITHVRYRSHQTLLKLLSESSPRMHKLQNVCPEWKCLRKLSAKTSNFKRPWPFFIQTY